MPIYPCIDRESCVAVSAAATALTATKIRRTDGKTVMYAQIQILTYAAAFTCDGSTDPSSTVGQQYHAFEVFEVWGAADLLALKDIRIGSNDCTYDVTYFGTVS